LFVLFFFSTLENSAYNPQFSSPWPVFWLGWLLNSIIS
jgi:hypothetical protein